MVDSVSSITCLRHVCKTLANGGGDAWRIFSNTTRYLLRVKLDALINNLTRVFTSWTTRTFCYRLKMLPKFPACCGLRSAGGTMWLIEIMTIDDWCVRLHFCCLHFKFLGQYSILSCWDSLNCTEMLLFLFALRVRMYAKCPMGLVEAKLFVGWIN